MSVKLLSVKKKRCKEGSAFSLPINLNTNISGSQILYYGRYIYGSILIEDRDSARALWNNGFFGDGSLSISGLRYSSLTDDAHISKSIRSEEEIEAKITEVLHLLLEEGLFLSYALGTLVLNDESGKEMNIDEMWSSFSALDSRFPLQYAVYHHFTCKKWVVKPGIKFGADWILYSDGPPFTHSQYMIWVQCLWEDDLTEDSSMNGRKCDLTNISAIERLSGHVAKNLILCQVLRPRDVSNEDLKSIECLKRLTITETLIQHWVAGKLIGDDAD